MAGGEKENQALLAALSHPLRRQILRLMPEEAEKAISPVQLAADLEERLTHVSYHVRVLANCGAAKLVRTEKARGATRHYYRRTIEADWAKQVLEKPERELRGKDS